MTPSRSGLAKAKLTVVLEGDVKLVCAGGRGYASDHDCWDAHSFCRCYHFVYPFGFPVVYFPVASVPKESERTCSKAADFDWES